MEKITDPKILAYIEIMSDITRDHKVTTMSNELSVDRKTIYNWRKKYPELDSIIAANIKKQYDILSQKAHKALYRGLEKGNAKLVELALQLTGDYTPKTDITNRYDNMTKDQLMDDIKMKLTKYNQA